MDVEGIADMQVRGEGQNRWVSQSPETSRFQYDIRVRFCMLLPLHTAGPVGHMDCLNSLSLTIYSLNFRFLPVI